MRFGGRPRMRTRPRVGIAIAVASLLGSLAPGAAQGVAAGAAPAGPATGPVTAFFDVAYEVVGSQTFELDVYEPGDGLTHPGVLLVHGGAWTKGDKSLWVEAPPIDQVDASDAPAYLANSTKEHTPLSQATSMADALAAAGVPEQLRVIKGKLHARAYEAKVWSQSLSFLHEYLDGATPAASRLTHGARVLSSPVVGDGIVYVGAEDGSVHAFGAVTGSPLWSAVAGAIIDSTPALADGRVYAGSQDGSVRAFDAVTGSPVWQSAAPLGSFADVSPVTDGGHLFAASEDGALQALDDGTGGSAWTTGPGTGVVARIQFRPAVSGGLVVTGSNNGRLSALDEGTGGAMWTRPASG